MNQYSPKNQAFLLSQLPTASDVRSFKAWKAAGRSVCKGEKALRVWIPKVKGDGADPALLTEEQRSARFVRGPVFDISQTKPTPPSKREKSAKAARMDYQIDASYAEFDAAVAAGDIPADLDMGIWLELRDETRMAAILADVASDYTIATHAGTIIAQVEHHSITY